MDNTNDKRREEHLARRRSQGVVYSDLAQEFGSSKSTVHRKMQTIHARSKEQENAIDE